MRIYQLIFTHKNIPKALWDNDIHTIIVRENIVVIIHIYGDKAIFLLFYDDQDTDSQYLERHKSVSQLIWTHINI